MFPDNLSFRLSISHLSGKDNNTGFTTVGIFDLHMKLHRAIKPLGGCSDLSLFHHVFSEMKKADFSEPLNVPCLGHAQESFGRVKAKKSVTCPTA